MSEQIISKQRVAKHGEVFTAQREVNAMLDLVKTETERIDSRFLEPACGKGAFLTEILKRKLLIIKQRYGKKRFELDYQRYVVLAVSSIYGIDILEDNIKDCRDLLLGICVNEYTSVFKSSCINVDFLNSIKFILSKNIIHGDALTLKIINSNNSIIFSEWSLVKGSLFKRRDFYYSNLIDPIMNGQFDKSDNGNQIWSPIPIKEFPLTHFKELINAE